jgi:hypothetical protein
MAVIWFRPPSEDEGLLNACYNALDVHVIRGRADDLAVRSPDRDLTFAELLTEVAAFAGVLRAFGVGLGDEVLVRGLPTREDVVAQLACARLGAVPWDVPPANAVLAVLGTAAPEELGELPVITIDDTAELQWATALRAGRTDPGGCAEVPGSHPLRVVAGVAVNTAAHLAAVVAGEVVDPIFTPLVGGDPVDLTSAAGSQA